MRFASRIAVAAVPMAAATALVLPVAAHAAGVPAESPRPAKTTVSDTGDRRVPVSLTAPDTEPPSIRALHAIGK
ncbi:hypothetical protein [Streptomyces vinaceus]|uniref:hypothetical protein n=1 Tax=Streptomyces vinaceus TaxID=1960 RepID=UPI00369CBEBD